MATEKTIRVRVNGNLRTATVPVRRTLADFLREDLGLTGTHLGCEHGACGACTVIFDGQAVRSCLLLAVQAEGHEITTVEGLAGPEGEPGVLQQAFWDHQGLQCGFCTPGMLCSAAALLQENPHPTATEVRERLSGNLCRCTGYQGIVESVLAAAEAMNTK